MDQPSGDDDQLLAEVRIALTGHDAVPATVSEAAKAAYSWRTIDAELAALSYDSFLDDKELAGVRSAAGEARMLTFDAGELTVEIAIERGRIIGQLVPPQAGEIQVRYAGGSTTVQADEMGIFTCDDVPRGPVSLRCTGVGAVPVVTDWIVL